MGVDKIVNEDRFPFLLLLKRQQLLNSFPNIHGLSVPLEHELAQNFEDEVIADHLKVTIFILKNTFHL